MVNMGSWGVVDLRQRKHSGGPYDDQLVAIRWIERAGWHTERYHVGTFFTEEGKSWFRASGGSVFDVAKLKKKYDLWWTPLPKAKPAEDMLRESWARRNE